MSSSPTGSSRSGGSEAASEDRSPARTRRAMSASAAGSTTRGGSPCFTRLWRAQSSGSQVPRTGPLSSPLPSRRAIVPSAPGCDSHCTPPTPGPGPLYDLVAGAVEARQSRRPTTWVAVLAPGKAWGRMATTDVPRSRQRLRSRPLSAPASSASHRQGRTRVSPRAARPTPS